MALSVAVGAPEIVERSNIDATVCRPPDLDLDLDLDLEERLAAAFRIDLPTVRVGFVGVR
jgi:hypothetical protein